MKFHTLAIATLVLVLRAPAQSIDAETWAEALIDSPFLVTDDEDARAAQWLELVERDSGHPLAELALRMIDGLRGDTPSTTDQRLLALSGARMTPAAVAVLTKMQSQRRAARTPLDGLGQWKPGELYGDRLARGLVLGPLADPLDSATRARLFAEPGFERDHSGPFEWPVRWQALTRAQVEPAFDPDDALLFESGWALCAFFFDVPGGGPAWIELDFSDDVGPRWIAVLSAREGSFSSTLGDPSCDVALNGAAPARIDFLAAERSLVERLPIVLRDGRNRLLLASNLDARVRFAIRVLGADGRPLRGLTERDRDAPLGADVAAPAPAQPLATAESFLADLPQRSAMLEALLGVVEFNDGRCAQAVERLERAAALAPESVGARMLLAEIYNASSYLPDNWRRARQREIVEALVGEDPANVRMQVALARILAPEDREDEALAAVRSVENVSATSPVAPLELASLFAKLELQVPEERALQEAERRAPHSPRVLARLVRHWSEHGQPARALEHSEAALREAGCDAQSLGDLAGQYARLGRVDNALALHRAAAALGGENALHGLAVYLESLRAFEPADALLAQLEARHANVPFYALRRADIARRRGDREGEAIQLREALRRDVSNDEARERLRALTGQDDTRDFFARWATDATKELAGFDATLWKEHVVRQIDSAVVRVFADGAWEQVTHERDIAGDLAGCEALGKLSPAGDVLRIATIKTATNVEYEPVFVDGEYVMPALEPGDVVEVLSRVTGSAPADGVVRLPRWYFGSVDKPFFLTRYVVSIPKALELRLVLRNFDGEHTTRDEGDSVVHEFVRRRVERVVPEPGSPPQDWYLPWLVFGEDRALDGIAAELAREIVVPTRVTPEIRSAALEASADVASESERARKLYAFAVNALDKRSPASFASATAALLTREGNATLLYAALLDAAGIDNELVWSRNVAPEADGEPDPAFVDSHRWMRGLYVLVRPDDGPQAWCELSSKTMPYGTIVNAAPRAPAFATRSQRWIELPDVPLVEQVGRLTDIVVTLGAQREADVALEFRITGNAGFPVKEQMREAPKAQLKQLMQRICSQLISGLTMKEHELRGLDDERAELVFSAQGTHKSFLDEQQGELVCKLPFPALQLGRGASGEGRRTQPYFMSGARIERTRARFALPAGLTLAQPMPELREEFHGASYRLALEDVTDSGFTVVRDFIAPPILLAPEQFADFVTFAKRVDEAERTRLHFSRAP